MASYLEIAETQKSLEQTILKIFSDFEARLKSPAAKVTTGSLSEEFSAFMEYTFSLLKLLRDQIKAVSKSQDDMEMRHRRKYLLFKGVPEDPGECVSSSVSDIIIQRLGIPDVSIASFKACHRLGKLTESRSRPILVRFADMSLRS